MLRFSACILTKVIFYVLKIIKIYENVGVAIKSAHALIWRQMAVFQVMDNPILEQLLEMDLWDPIEIKTALKVIKCANK